MSTILITDARIAARSGTVDHGWLLAVDGRIAKHGPGAPEPAAITAVEEASTATVINAAGQWLMPGFIDVHVHGALGHEAMDGSVDGLAQMAGFYAQHGVTGFLATTWTGSHDETVDALRGVAQGMDQVEGGARIFGAHMEGPYLNPERCGAQDKALIRRATPEEVDTFFSIGAVRLITVAPEIEGSLDLIDECHRRGIAVSAGHTDATYAQMAQAVPHGVQHVTHTFNAMRPLHHREPGVIGAAMTMSELSVELIADNVHVHPVIMDALLNARGTGAVVLVTDAMRATGMPTGEYAVGDRQAFKYDGAVRLANGALAGSVLTMDAALRNFQQATKATLGDLWATTSGNAARLAGVADRTGAIAAGLDADLVIVDDEVRVSHTIVEGRVVHRSGNRSTVPVPPNTISASGGRN